MTNRFLKVLIVILIVVFVFLIQNWRKRYYNYQCGYCCKQFSLPIWQAVLAPHILFKKYVKCPYCGKRTWAEPVVKE